MEIEGSCLDEQQKHNSKIITDSFAMTGCRSATRNMNGQPDLYYFILQEIEQQKYLVYNDQLPSIMELKWFQKA